ncbi:MAG: ABC transporter ATP-binding protein [Deltaproteobacteria bacterium]|nr:ABC transporter ATP-binding protein [Deltaproteobacteria bacterium]
MGPLLKLIDVRKCYSSGPKCDIFPLAGVSFELLQCERVILLGKSGSGKSTFLNIVGGMDSPTQGQVFFDGSEITRMSPVDLAHYRRREVGFIFQSFNLFPTLTVGENVTLPLDLLGIRNYAKAHEILSAVGLDGYWRKFPETLSGGEQQRVAIARALVKRPRLILADEPTGNLDQETGNGILKLIDEICNESEASLIMVTHSADALWLAPKHYRLKSGILIEDNYVN